MAFNRQLATGCRPLPRLPATFCLSPFTCSLSLLLAFPPPYPYNTAMDSQATVLCETEKNLCLIPCGRQCVVSRPATAVHEHVTPFRSQEHDLGFSTSRSGTDHGDSKQLKLGS
jgi:hypothetical protein